AADEVAGARRRAADGVAAGEHGDAAVGVADGGVAGDVGADVVALDHVVRGADAGEFDAAEAAVAADDVAGRRRRAADDVAPHDGAGGGAVQLHAGRVVVPAQVAQRGGAGGVGADEVARDRVVDRADQRRGGVDVQAGGGVAAEDVAADEVVGRVEDG